MAGEIKHKWTGTVLTITSDSGTSSVDLKGKKGDRGVRGAQGRAGVILKEDGTVDMSGYATEEYVEDLIDGIDISAAIDIENYYTKPEIDATISGVHDVINSIDVTEELTNYYTKDETYSDDEVDSLVGEINENINDIEADLTTYATETFVLNSIEEALEDYTPSGGGGTGGGGSTNNAVLTLKSTTGWTYKTIADGGTCTITGNWTSLEDGLETGGGTLLVTVGGVVKHSVNVVQGDFTVNVAPYLSIGSNTVKVKITDIYGNSRSIAFTIKKVSIYVTSTFDAAIPYEGAISYVYTPVGNLTKNVYFVLDGKEIGTATVTTSGRQQGFTIPAQSHGSHTFEVYFTSEVEGETVESNRLYYDLICIESGKTTPIISCPFNREELEQYEVVNIPYTVYNPSYLTSIVVLKENDETVSTLTVDRTQQIWAYRAEEYGDISLTITCDGVAKTLEFTVKESDIKAEAETEKLELYLTSYGRSNGEADKDSWTYGNIACSFKNYNWKTDGWQLDDDGVAVHRVTGDARLTIPLKMFSGDFRATGKTIEFEFATRNVMDYDAEIISCMSDNKGFKLTAQKAILKSEQSELSTQYKENEHIRLSFVVDKRVENRLIYIYLNGIMCGATQYPDDDDFSQGNPVNITIGSNNCTIDLYNIRVYNNNLTHYQIMDNWIADTQNIEDKLSRYNRNNVYDDFGNIIIENLPSDLPYLVLEAKTLPQYKGNKVTVSGRYVNPVDTAKSFTFENAEADVQGTSSAGYARKNYKIKFKNGLTQNGVLKETYQMRSDSIPTAMFTFKADVASSEGANNVELVRLYNDISPYKTPPQEVNESVRQGIDGFPIVIFHDDGENVSFIGKYNFNNDKGTPEVFGMTTGDESWEIRNNTSNRVIWKSADYSGTDWKNDFEARYPEDNEDISNLSHFAEWVVSTDREQATGEAITPVTYEDVEYTTDTAEYRLAKFKAEINDYAELQSALFYYLFTELFLMVDSRAKNAFPSLIGGDKICWLPYDMDTAAGINNEGALVFGYELEDIDKTSTGADVYNGQDSVFWCNIRDAFGTELEAMYQQLRSDDKVSYEIVEKAYEEHQNKWCEAIWNEDAYYKYLEPLIVDGSGIYLSMLQGNKSEQRKWWLYNRFRYIDSKYTAGDALKDFITLRGYAKSDITIEPYADIYAAIKYGSYIVKERALRGSEYTLACPLDNLNDTEIYIYSASQLKDIGDISGLKVGLADFSTATKLQNLKIGDNSVGYSNNNLTSLTLGNNTLLKSLDVRNCPMLGTGEQQSVDVSGCTGIEHIYFEGTAIKGIKLPAGGMLKTLHLPNTITSLKLVNQTALTDFELNDYSNISSLRIENTPKVDSSEIFLAMKDNGRVRLLDIDWTLDTYSKAITTMNKLYTMRGLDENDNNTDAAQVSGKIAVTWRCLSDLSGWRADFPNVEFEVADVIIENISWDEIDSLVKNGYAETYINVGDKKTIELSDGEVITVMVLGFNHDNLADDSGKATITFGMENCLENTSSFDNDAYYSPYSGSTIQTLVNSNYFAKLPSDLQAIIKTVKKVSRYKTYYNDDARTVTTKDNVFLLSAYEILGYTSDWFGQDGTQYEYFANETDTDAAKRLRIKGLGNNPTEATSYWTRSGNIKPETGYIGSIVIGKLGTIYSQFGTNNNEVHGVSFGFCI